jgi:restriction system protein
VRYVDLDHQLGTPSRAPPTVHRDLPLPDDSDEERTMVERPHLGDWRERRRRHGTDRETRAAERRRKSLERVRRAEEAHRHEMHEQKLVEAAAVRTEKVEQRVQKLTTILLASLSRSAGPLDFDALKDDHPGPDLGTDAEPVHLPQWEEYAPRPVPLLGRLLDRVAFRTERRRRAEAVAEKAFSSALDRYRKEEEARQGRVDRIHQLHNGAYSLAHQRVARHNRSIDEFRSRVLGRDRGAVSEYFAKVSASIPDRSGFPRDRRFAYVPESRLLLIEWQMPDVDLIPRAKTFHYNRESDAVEVHKWRAVGEIREIYRELLAQLALRATNWALAADPNFLVEVVVVNGVVDGGGSTRPCLITMRATRKHFGRLHLENVDPVDCVRKHFSAGLSAYPDELAAETPVLEFELADPTGGGQPENAPSARTPNLLDVPAKDFERLTHRLLERMGFNLAPMRGTDTAGDLLATRTDPGGRKQYVVRVHRSSPTVDASDLRGLNGAVRRERASGGIFLTTGGFRPQAYEYANGKPLQLYDGHGLLVLCRRHGIPARIERTGTRTSHSTAASNVPAQRRAPGQPLRSNG